MDSPVVDNYLVPLVYHPSDQLNPEGMQLKRFSESTQLRGFLDSSKRNTFWVYLGTSIIGLSFLLWFIASVEGNSRDNYRDYPMPPSYTPYRRMKYVHDLDTLGSFVFGGVISTKAKAALESKKSEIPTFNPLMGIILRLNAMINQLILSMTPTLVPLSLVFTMFAIHFRSFWLLLILLIKAFVNQYTELNYGIPSRLFSRDSLSHLRVRQIKEMYQSQIPFSPSTFTYFGFQTLLLPVSPCMERIVNFTTVSNIISIQGTFRRVLIYISKAFQRAFLLLVIVYFGMVLQGLLRYALETYTGYGFGWKVTPQGLLLVILILIPYQCFSDIIGRLLIVFTMVAYGVLRDQLTGSLIDPQDIREYTYELNPFPPTPIQDVAMGTAQGEIDLTFVAKDTQTAGSINASMIEGYRELVKKAEDFSIKLPLSSSERVLVSTLEDHFPEGKGQILETLRRVTQERLNIFELRMNSEESIKRERTRTTDAVLERDSDLGSTIEDLINARSRGAINRAMRINTNSTEIMQGELKRHLQHFQAITPHVDQRFVLVTQRYLPTQPLDSSAKIAGGAIPYELPGSILNTLLVEYEDSLNKRQLVSGTETTSSDNTNLVNTLLVRDSTSGVSSEELNNPLGVIGGLRNVLTLRGASEDRLPFFARTQTASIFPLNKEFFMPFCILTGFCFFTSIFGFIALLYPQKKTTQLVTWELGKWYLVIPIFFMLASGGFLALSYRLSNDFFFGPLIVRDLLASSPLINEGLTTA